MHPRHLLLGLAGIGFITSLIWGPRSGFQWYRLRSTLQDLELQMIGLQKEQTQLKSQIEELKTNPYAQLKTIRETIGFIGNDETLFQFFSNHDPNPN